MSVSVGLVSVTIHVPQRRVKWLGWIPDHPDPRDFSYALGISREELFSTPDEAGVEDVWDKAGYPILNQLLEGSCTGNGNAEAAVFAAIKEGEADPTFPSRQWIYYYERAMEGTVDSDAGAQVRDGIKVMAKLGYPPESAWPYESPDASGQGGNMFDEPDQQAHAAVRDHITAYFRVPLVSTWAMEHCIASGFPFVFGFSVFSSFPMDAHDRDSAVVPMPALSDSLDGGHCVVACRYYRKLQLVRCRNSWGPDWGDGGYFYLPYSYITDPMLASDAWKISKEAQKAA